MTGVDEVGGGAARAQGPLSVARVMGILEALSGTDEALSLTVLSRRLGAPKSSLVGLLRVLCDENFVAVAEGRYKLGGRSFDLAGAMMASRKRLHLSDNIREGMLELNRQTDESVLYAILNQDGPATMTYLDIVEGRGAIRISVTIGDRSPLYCTAGGRVLLAGLDDTAVRAYLERVRLDAVTSLTVTDPETLLQIVRQVRAEGHSLMRDEMIEGVTGLAAPIRGSSGETLGALIIAGPTMRLGERSAELVVMVERAAAKISDSLGFRN